MTALTWCCCCGERLSFSVQCGSATSLVGVDAWLDAPGRFDLSCAEANQGALAKAIIETLMTASCLFELLIARFSFRWIALDQPEALPRIRPQRSAGVAFIQRQRQLTPSSGGHAT